jgi:hypothetical protein
MMAEGTKGSPKGLCSKTGKERRAEFSVCWSYTGRQLLYEIAYLFPLAVALKKYEADKYRHWLGTNIKDLAKININSAKEQA